MYDITSAMDGKQYIYSLQLDYPIKLPNGFPYSVEVE